MQGIDSTSSLDLGLLGFDNAARAIGLAIIFDVLDGKIARLVGSASNFGREFDSLADILAFGMAPALLCFVWGVAPALTDARTTSPGLLNVAGWFVACAFLVCGALRLARFNLDSEQPVSEHRHFVGLPIPGGAAVIAAIVHFVKRPIDDFGYAVAWLFLVGILGLLMISRLPYKAFVPMPGRMRHRVLLLVFVCLLVSLFWAYANYVILLLVLGYVISAPIAYVVLRLRSRAIREQS
jgi:CDP-diacylglycerol--serine O-phosphatidyltransferase